jgi:hypothetical protein
MLHHASFAVDEPAMVAEILTGMLGATAIRAPAPPFPAGSWFVCFGDEAGSFLEVLPRGHVLDPDARFGSRPEAGAPRLTAAHVLVGTPLSADAVMRMAGHVGWKAEVADTRLFRVVKVWVENAVLLELLLPEMAESYRRTFDAVGVADLDRRLRRLEAGEAS